MARKLAQRGNAREKAGNYLPVLFDDPALPQPIRINLVQSSDDKSSWSLRWSRQKMTADTIANDPEKTKKLIGLLGRPARAEEIANVVLFLVSEDFVHDRQRGRFRRKLHRGLTHTKPNAIAAHEAAPLHAARLSRPDHRRGDADLGAGTGHQDPPGICSDAQIEGWRKVTDAVHARGGRIFLQMWHTGRVSHTSVQPGGVAPVAPSAIRTEAKTFVNGGFASRPRRDPCR
jgi:hypothetical protein